MQMELDGTNAIDRPDETEPPKSLAEEPPGSPVPLSEELAAGVGPGALEDIPEYSGEPYAIINDNIPFFDRAG